MPEHVHKLEVVTPRDPADPDRKVKVRDAKTGIQYWMIPTDETNETFVLRTIQ